MQLFRSDEHVAKWLDGRAPGEVISIAKLSELAQAWWGDRLDAAWRPHTRDQNQAILDGLGLDGAFWRLPG
jgi:regulator of RNase E activity RraA